MSEGSISLEMPSSAKPLKACHKQTNKQTNKGLDRGLSTNWNYAMFVI